MTLWIAASFAGITILGLVALRLYVDLEMMKLEHQALETKLTMLEQFSKHEVWPRIHSRSMRS
jgi:hypothetical protein